MQNNTQSNDFHVKINILKRFFYFLWQSINTLRKIVLNLLFLFVVVIIIATLSHKKERVVIPKSTALVLNINGDIVEQKHRVSPVNAFVNEAFGKREKRQEVLLRDITKVIYKAQHDNRIKLLVLNLQQLHRAGLTKLREIGKALISFKSSGKQIIALGDQYTQDQYYLASYANKIWLNPQGWLLLEGYGDYPLYFKSALDKLNISQHIFRVGTYKSAVEPYMRDNMSPAAKEENAQWLNELWNTYKSDVAKQRGFSIDNFDETMATLLPKFQKSGSSIAEYALNNHFVDALKTRESMRNDLIKLVGKNKSGTSFKQVDFNDYLSTIPKINKVKNSKQNEIAIIIAKGTILNGDQPPGSIGGDSTAKLLRKARYNKQVKAVVLRVDSPGGSSFASEIIRQEVELLKAAGKPVVASMGTYGASGGYWISAAANKIIAEPTTITGSIGIFGMMMTFDKALNKLGIHSDGVGTTELAGFNPTRPMTEGMANLFQLNINRGYHDFISLVAKNRHMTLKQVDAIAQGHVWTGKKAKELGLVDQLGNLNDAIVEAAKLAKINKYDTFIIKQKVSTKDKLLQDILGQSSLWFNISVQPSQTTVVDQFIGTISSELNKMKSFNDPQGMYSLCDSCILN